MQNRIGIPAAAASRAPSRAARLQWIGVIAIVAVTALAAVEAWPPLYRAGLPGNSPSIAGCEAAAIIGLPIAAALVIWDLTQRGEPIPVIAPLTIAGSIAIILFVCDYQATTAAAVIAATVPVLTAGFSVGWLLVPERTAPEVPEVAAAEDGPLADPTVVYRFYRADGQLLYVGITRNFDRRERAHARLKPWWPEVAKTETATYASRAAAARAEHTAINNENPLHNVARYSLAAHLRSAGAL